MPGVVTLPRYFKQNGYYVLGAGKLYPDSDAGFQRSFHEFTKVDPDAVFNINQYIYNNGPKGDSRATIQAVFSCTEGG